MKNTARVYTVSEKFDISDPIVAPEIKPQQGVRDFSADTAIAPCPSCGSIQINLVRMPDFATHYAAKRCKRCHVFRGWEPKPTNQQKWQQQQTRIAELLLSDQVSDWEREFLTNVQGKRSLSPKQQEVLARIETKVGEQR